MYLPPAALRSVRSGQALAAQKALARDDHLRRRGGTTFYPDVRMNFWQVEKQVFVLRGDRKFPNVLGLLAIIRLFFFCRAVDFSDFAASDLPHIESNSQA
jgi:hypothetical protein